MAGRILRAAETDCKRKVHTSASKPQELERKTACGEVPYRLFRRPRTDGSSRTTPPDDRVTDASGSAAVMSQSSQNELPLSQASARRHDVVLEPLEGRRLCSAGSLPLSMVARLAVQGLYIDCTEDVAGTRGAVMSAVASASPTVTGIRLSSGAGAAFLDAFVAADVRLPTSGHGIDADRLTSATVRLYKSNLGPTSLVPANLDTSGGGDAIVLQPT